MAKTSFCGIPSELPLNPTVDQLAKEVERIQPRLWKQLYTKIIQPPNGYNSWKLPAVAISVAIMEGARRSKGATAGSANNIRACATVLMKYDFPTYYIGRELLRSLINTKPPEKPWQDIPLPFPGMTFMLPEGFIREPHTGKSINFLSYTRLGFGKDAKSVLFKDPDVDRMHIWYAIDNGINLQSVVFPVNQKLEPSADWLKQATDYYDDYYQKLGMVEQRDRLPRPPNEFLAYISSLVANLILVKQARPELQSESGSGHVNTAKNGNRFYRPIWIGQKYRSQRGEGVEKAEADGHFTELRWRSGHWRLQHHGPGNKQTKVIWIESFICHGGNLVKETNKTLTLEEVKP